MGTEWILNWKPLDMVVGGWRVWDIGGLFFYYQESAGNMRERRGRKRDPEGPEIYQRGDRILHFTDQRMPNTVPHPS